MAKKEKWSRPEKLAFIAVILTAVQTILTIIAMVL